jgi:hypothetical protein
LGGAQSFQLNRDLLRGVANRKSTMQNLAATLAVVDRTHPKLSPLLTVPRRTHGEMEGPIFGPRQAQAFKHLVDWVALVAPAEPKNDSPPSADDTSESTAQNGPAAPNVVSPVLRVPTSPEPSKTEQPRDMTVDDENSESLPGPHRLQRGARLATWQPIDEFDPEIFNRAQGNRPRANRAAVEHADLENSLWATCRLALRRLNRAVLRAGFDDGTLLDDRRAPVLAATRTLSLAPAALAAPAAAAAAAAAPITSIASMATIGNRRVVVVAARTTAAALRNKDRWSDKSGENE